MLTIADLDEIEKIIDEKLDDKLKNLPTKAEFFDEISKVMGELQAIRNDNEILNGRTSNHTDELENHEKRITKVEKHFLQ